MTISIAQQVSYDITVLIAKLSDQAVERGMTFSADKFGVTFAKSNSAIKYQFIELIQRGFIAWSTGIDMPVDIDDKWGLLRNSYSMRDLIRELNRNFLPELLKDNPEEIRVAAGWKMTDDDARRMNNSTSLLVIYENGAAYERIFQDAPLMLLHKIGCLEMEGIKRNSLCSDMPETLSFDFTQRAKDHYFQIQTDAMNHLRQSYGVNNA